MRQALFQPSVTNRGDDIVLAVEDGSEFYKNAGGDMYIITVCSLAKYHLLFWFHALF